MKNKLTLIAATLLLTACGDSDLNGLLTEDFDAALDQQLQAQQVQFDQQLANQQLAFDQQLAFSQLEVEQVVDYEKTPVEVVEAPAPLVVFQTPVIVPDPTPAPVVVVPTPEPTAPPVVVVPTPAPPVVVVPDPVVVEESETLFDSVFAEPENPVEEITMEDIIAIIEEEQTPFDIADEDVNAEPELDPDGETIFRTVEAHTSRTWNPNPNGWGDSYSVGNRCFFDTTLDHGIGDIVVETPFGDRTVEMVQQIIGNGPGIEFASARYNTVQCGHEPSNDFGDEDVGECPGRIDMGPEGCSIQGPKWYFEE